MKLKFNLPESIKQSSLLERKGTYALAEL